MDASDDRVRDALKRSVPTFDDGGVLQSVVRRGHTAQRRRRVETTVLAILAVAAAAFMVVGISHALRNLPPIPPVITMPSPAPSPGTDILPVRGTVERLQEQPSTADSTTGAVTQTRTGTLSLRIQLSDPRVSGTAALTFSEDVREDQSATMQGTSVLSNEKGTWLCSEWSGTIAKGGQAHTAFLEYRGAGGYAGLVFFCQLYWLDQAETAEQTMTVSGWIETAPL